MAKTYLQYLVAKITTAIDRSLAKGDISKSHRQELYKALFFLLAGDPEVRKELIEYCKQHRRYQVLVQIYKAVGVSVKLPQALHASSTKNVSIRKAQSIWKVSKSDLKLIEELAAVAQVDPEAEQHLLRQYYSSSELHWLAEVEDELEDVEVIINTQALEDMLMGVFETYKVPKSKTVPYSEVFGLCLGMASRHKVTKKGAGTRTKWFVYVDKAVPQIRARGSIDSVTPNNKSIEAVVETASALFPQLEIIGDYHSHPYKNVKKLKACRGWEASEPDVDHIIELYKSLRENPSRQHRMRVTFIVAIAKGRNVNKPASNPAGLPNVLHMSMAGCHLYFSAYRILSNGVMTNRGVTLVRNAGQSYFNAS